MNTENTIKIEGLKCEKTAPAIGPYSKATKVNISPNTYTYIPKHTKPTDRQLRLSTNKHTI